VVATTPGEAGAEVRVRARANPHGCVLNPHLTTKKQEPPDTGGGRVLSFDETFGILATCWRLWRRGDS